MLTGHRKNARGKNEGGNRLAPAGDVSYHMQGAEA